MMLSDFLWKKNADVNASDNHGHTSLIYASKCKCPKHDDIVRVLVENNADVNAKDNDGATSLMYASGQGNLAIVRLLLEKGAKINERDNIGKTALDFAIK